MMNILKYITYLPIWLIIYKFNFIKTKQIIYTYNNDHFENIRSNIIIFNVCYLIYEFIFHYIYYLYDFYKVIILYLFIFRNFINMFLYRKNAHNIIIRNINLSIYFNTIILIVQNYILFYKIKIENNDENNSLKRGYINMMLLSSYLYYICFLYIIIIKKKDLKLSYSTNILQDINNNVCCICLEEIQINDHSKLTCCFNYIHTKCIEEYLNYNQNHICPLCRKNFQIINYINL